MPKKRRQTTCRKPATLDKGRRAFELRSMGWSFPEVADDLKMSVGGVHELYTAFVELSPRQDTESHRRQLLATLDRALKANAKDLDSRDPRTRQGAARAIARLASTYAQVSGVVKLAPMVVVMASAASEEHVDVTRASLDDLRELEAIRKRMMAPALEAHVVVEQPGGEHDEREEQRGTEGRGDSGDRSAVDDRT